MKNIKKGTKFLQNKFRGIYLKLLLSTEMSLSLHFY